MNPLDDDQYSSYLASQDDAMASGRPYSTVLEETNGLPSEVLDRFKQDVEWCEFVRSALTRHGAGPPTEGDEHDWFAGTSGPSRFGRFEITRELGRGAFGVVFLAYDPRLRRQVALKVPRPEVVVTREMRERFEREARAAAVLDHPNLVPVFDAGEEGSVSYIASAYCPGPTLAAWLKSRAEPVPPRLTARVLFLLARAIAHAHARGVLHRDLKPGNIILEPLPDGSPASGQRDGLDFTPRVTDFGLARVRPTGAEATAATHTGEILGTPAYMSPEQAAGGGGTVGPAADVYGLGAILYALLVGRPPFQADSVLDTLLLLRTQEPVAPSRLRPRLPRDLETICLKCLRKEPQKRYVTAMALADDLDRFLAGQPVHARPAPAWELAIKWARRHPALAALIGTAVSAAVALTVVIGRANVRLQHERDVAEARRLEAVANLRKAREAVDRLLSRVGEVRLRDIPQVEPIQRALLEDALEFYRDFARRAQDDPEVLLEVSRAYNRVGRAYASSGWNDLAERCCIEALALQKQLAASFPNAASYRLALARTHHDLGTVRIAAGRDAEALEPVRESLAILETLIGKSPNDASYRGERASNHEWRSVALFHLGRNDEAEAECRKAIDMWDELATEFPQNKDYPGRAALGRSNLAATLVRQNRLDEAEAVYRKIVEFWEKRVQNDPLVPDNRSKLALTLQNLAAVIAERGRDAQAEKAYRRAADLRRGLAKDFPNFPHHLNQLGYYLTALGKLAAKRGDLAEVCLLKEQAIAAFRATLALAPKNQEYLHYARGALVEFTEYLIQLGDHDDATKTIAELVELSPGLSPESFRAAKFQARCVPLAAADKRLPDAKRSELAAHYAARAIELLRESFKTGHVDSAAINKDPSFESLRSRVDFQALVGGPRKADKSN
jgi:tetratricopeptide (TPR) repeat protein